MQGMRTNWPNAIWEAVAVRPLHSAASTETVREPPINRPGTSEMVRPLLHAVGLSWALLATALDYALDLLGLKATGTWVHFWHPVRLLGTLAGLLLLYGTSLSLIRRLRKADETSTHSTVSDWAFLILLWLTGVSGFLLEIAVYLPSPAPWMYWTLVGHITVAAGCWCYCLSPNSPTPSIARLHCISTRSNCFLLLNQPRLAQIDSIQEVKRTNTISAVSNTRQTVAKISNHSIQRRFP